MKPSFEELFEQATICPDIDLQERFGMLVGLDEQKSQLIRMLGLLVNPVGIIKWSERFHPDAKMVTDMVLRRPPLVVFAGDVGSGKSELANTIGDAVARQERIQITLLPLSLSARGQGRVGQMTQLISTAFEHALEKAKKLKHESGKSNGAVILLVDEADALAQSRESSQMHHEDKAGVNAFIRGVDSLGNGKLPVAVIMCTNRPNALDPAIKRRAADIYYFKRPNEIQRHAVLDAPLKALGLSDANIEEIVTLTGPKDGANFGFTYSDLTQRLIPSIVLDAYPDNAIIPQRAVEISRKLVPTPPFNETE